MKLAFLNAMPRHDEQAWGIRQLDSFQTFFAQTDRSVQLTEYRVTEGDLPALPNDYDAYIISGSPAAAYETETWILQLGDFVRTVYQEGQQAMVGICFGHQLLAHALGGETRKADAWGLGRRDFQLMTRPAWMTAVNTTVALYYAHQDQVVRLPEPAQCLATSAFCPYEMFVIRDKVLGIQGHPEFSDEIAELTVDFLQEKVPQEVGVAASASLAQGAASGQLVSQWIVNFLNPQLGRHS